MPRGGSRANSGRKPGSINRKTAIEKADKPLSEIKGKAARKAVTAAVVLASIDELKYWTELLKDPKTRLQAMMYLTDQRDGKARQKLEHTGKDGGPVQVETSTPEENERRIAELLAKAK